mgnify:FL=1
MINLAHLSKINSLNTLFTTPNLSEVSARLSALRRDIVCLYNAPFSVKLFQ